MDVQWGLRDERMQECAKDFFGRSTTTTTSVPSKPAACTVFAFGVATASCAVDAAAARSAASAKTARTSSASADRGGCERKGSCL